MFRKTDSNSDNMITMGEMRNMKDHEDTDHWKKVDSYGNNN